MRRKPVYSLLLVLCALVFAGSLFMVLKTVRGYSRDKQAYEEIDSGSKKLRTVSKEKTLSESEQASLEAEEKAAGRKKPSYNYISAEKYEKKKALEIMSIDLSYILVPQYEFDFKALLARNRDVAGWIELPDTHIDYPIVKSRDNTEYLRRGPDGQPLNAGSIFIDCLIEQPFIEQHTIIYGHNQRNRMMFHDLLNFAKEDFALEHKYFYIYTPDNVRHVCEIFAAYETANNSETYRRRLDSDGIREYLQMCLTLSDVDFDVMPGITDRIVTLSTCTNEADTARYVVQARILN